MPFGWKGVFVALASGGVIFACLGFEQAVQLGGESRNPRRNIPLAIIVAMLVAIGLYIALQVAFIAALDPSSLSNGWGAISFSGKGQLFGPFAALATALGLGWLAVMLYTDAIVSPGGTGLLYTGASARLTFALARNGQIPGAFGRLTRRGTPLFAIAFSFVCGLVILLPFPGWQELVGFISAAAVLTYAMAPLALGALRRQDPARPRLFRLPAAWLVAPAAFVVASEILLFTGWAVVWKLIVAILIGFALLMVSALRDARARRSRSTGAVPSGSGRTCSAWPRSRISAHSTRERRARSRCSASTGLATCSLSAGTSSPSPSSAWSSSPSRSAAGFPPRGFVNVSAI